MVEKMQVPTKAPILLMYHLDPMKPKELVGYVVGWRGGRGRTAIDCVPVP